jgi:hypothetical protein
MLDSNLKLSQPSTRGTGVEQDGRLGTDEVVYLLLRLTPNLRNLGALHPSLSAGPPSRPSLPMYLSSIQERLDQDTHIPTHFESLVELEFCIKGLSWNCIAPLSHLPSLKKLFTTHTLLDSGRSSWKKNLGHSENMDYAFHFT